MAPASYPPIETRMPESASWCVGVAFGLGGRLEPQTMMLQVPIVDLVGVEGGGAPLEPTEHRVEQPRAADVAAQVAEAAGEGVAADDDGVEAELCQDAADRAVHDEADVANLAEAVAAMVEHLAVEEVTETHRGGFRGCGRRCGRASSAPRRRWRGRRRRRRGRR